MAPTATFEHRPVMVEEVEGLFAPLPTGTFVDATAGGGGHSASVLAACPQLRVIAIDQDEEAVAAASLRLSEFGDRAEVHRGRFDQLEGILRDSGHEDEGLVGILFDLGVSSYQLDSAERGFSYRFDAPLDMRMSKSSDHTAAQLLDLLSTSELADLFAQNGEEKFAMRIARAVEKAKPIRTTAELVEVVSSALPAAVRRRSGHPAKRVFQALRIAVNEELEVLAATLPVAIELLIPLGRCVAISYHSGEDRIVKSAFAQAVTGGCTCPPDLPCGCGAVRTAELLFRGAKRPTAREIAENPRSESARLRAVSRIEPTTGRPTDPPISGDLKLGEPNRYRHNPRVQSRSEANRQQEAGS